MRKRIIKSRSFLHIIPLNKHSLQQQIDLNGHTFGNKCCHCSKGLLYNYTPIRNCTYRPSFCSTISPMLLRPHFQKLLALWIRQMTRRLNVPKNVSSLLIIRACVPAHDKTYNNILSTSEDSDQPANPRSLIGVFADRVWLLQPPGYPSRKHAYIILTPLNPTFM